MKSVAGRQCRSDLKETYENALAILDSRRRPRRPTTEAKPDHRILPSQNGPPRARVSAAVTGTPSIVGMSDWLRLLGHTATSINGINIIHVAGTKGKGSTCAFTESFLRAHGTRTGFPSKIGLYTSPHLLVPEERIRINFAPISRDLFAQYFFEVYRVLLHAAVQPRYLQLYALVAFHTFIRERMDAAVVETHHGGEFDATNFVEGPVVTAVATLGMDHVKQLGPTLRDIAWHKAGIMKTGAVAVSAPQQDEAAEVLRERAREKGMRVVFVERDPVELAALDVPHLKPSVQRINCSLGLSVANAFLSQKGEGEERALSPQDVRTGVEQFSWPGRFQIILDRDRTWFLDAAHNELSITEVVKWFHEAAAGLNRSDAVPTRILIFSHVSNERDGPALFEALAKSLRHNNIKLRHVMFSSYRLSSDARRDQDEEETEHRESLNQLETRKTYAEIWKKHDPTAQIWDEPTIDGAVQRANEIHDEANGVQVLVTGSQYLVGGVLRLRMASRDLV